MSLAAFWLKLPTPRSSGSWLIGWKDGTTSIYPRCDRLLGDGNAHHGVEEAKGTFLCDADGSGDVAIHLAWILIIPNPKSQTHNSSFSVPLFSSTFQPPPSFFGSCTCRSRSSTFSRAIPTKCARCRSQRTFLRRSSSRIGPQDFLWKSFFSFFWVFLMDMFDPRN